MDFIQKLCNFYNISYEEYKKLIEPVTAYNLPSYTNFKDIDKAVQRIKKAIKNNEKIFIYGDYDCDGVMATSILVKAFSMLSYQVGYYLPSRYIDGYGLNVDKVRLAHEKGYSLIITVDNGVMQHEAIKEAKLLGMDVIVTDHHNVPNILPEADIILHPTYSSYGSVVCCGAYVAYMLAVGILSRHDEYLLSLAGIATISDLMELKEYNRNIVKLAIEYINKFKFEPIVLLVGSLDPLDETTIGMKIAPKINSVGRILEGTQINRLVTFFTTSSIEEREKIHLFIEEANKQRKELTVLAAETVKVDSSSNGIVLVSEEKEGLIGLIANKLLQEHNKPVIVFARSHDENVLKGSARSKQGFSIVKAFESMKDLLLVYGGHSLAGGCSINVENLDEFINRFESLSSIYKLEEEQDDTIELSMEEITFHNYNIYKALGPYGMGFKAPTFIIPKIKTNILEYSKDYRHIMYSLSMKTKIVGFNIGRDEISSYSWIKIEGKFSLNYFKGNETLQFVISKYELE